MTEGVLSSFSMRATITVDGELAERIERLSQERATSFEALANAALREGLEHLAGRPPRRRSDGRTSHTRPASLGGCLVESLDDIPGVLADGEGEGFK